MSHVNNVCVIRIIIIIIKRKESWGGEIVECFEVMSYRCIDGSQVIPIK